MAVRSLMGLIRPDWYRDVAWIRATWFGNDWVTLLVATPLLVTALVAARRGSLRGLLVWIGTLAYAVYNGAFYLLGAALNPFFPLDAAVTIVAAAALITALATVDKARVSQAVPDSGSARLASAYLVAVGAGLGCVWIGMWGAHVFAGRPTPVDPAVFRLVAALDLTLMVPALVLGGVLLWRRHRWGLIVAALAVVQASIYLLVLSVNAFVAIRRGLASAPGELPVWGTLFAVTSTVALLLLRGLGSVRVTNGASLRRRVRK